MAPQTVVDISLLNPVTGSVHNAQLVFVVVAVAVNIDAQSVLDTVDGT